MVDETTAQSLWAARKRARGGVSGAGVGRAEGVSRTALWKRVQTLRRLGYQIEAAAGVGYRLVGAPDRLYPWGGRGGRRRGAAPAPRPAGPELLPASRRPLVLPPPATPPFAGGGDLPLAAR